MSVKFELNLSLLQCFLSVMNAAICMHTNLNKILEIVEYFQGRLSISSQNPRPFAFCGLFPSLYLAISQGKETEMFDCHAILQLRVKLSIFRKPEHTFYSYLSLHLIISVMVVPARVTSVAAASLP